MKQFMKAVGTATVSVTGSRSSGPVAKGGLTRATVWRRDIQRKDAIISPRPLLAIPWAPPEHSVLVARLIDREPEAS